MEALNNPKLQEGFLNGNKENEILNEIVEILDWKTVRQPRVSPSPNTEKIVHVPARVNQPSHSPNTHKIPHVPVRGELMCEQKPAKTQINKPLTIYSQGTFIYKLFDKNTAKQPY